MQPFFICWRTRMRNLRRACTIRKTASRSRLCPLFPNTAERKIAALRLTLLDESLLAPTLTALLTSREAAHLRLGDAHFAITGALTTRQAHPLAGATTFAELRETPGREMLRVRFATPTVFRSHKRDVLWPEPRLVWQSWARSWHGAAREGSGMPEEAQITAWASAGVRVARHRVQTRKVFFGGGAQEGFVGECEYDLRDLEPSERAFLCALAAFAFYAGTGRKTAMGMGQTG